MNALMNQLAKAQTYGDEPRAFSNQGTLRRLAINDSGFVFDPVSGDSFTVNDTGIAVLRRLQEQCTLQETVHAISQSYDVDTRHAERDILDFIVQLRKHHK